MMRISQKWLTALPPQIRCRCQAFVCDWCKGSPAWLKGCVRLFFQSSPLLVCSFLVLLCYHGGSPICGSAVVCWGTSWPSCGAIIANCHLWQWQPGSGGGSWCPTHQWKAKAWLQVQAAGGPEQQISEGLYSALECGCLEQCQKTIYVLLDFFFFFFSSWRILGISKAVNLLSVFWHNN